MAYPYDYEDMDPEELQELFEEREDREWAKKRTEQYMAEFQLRQFDSLFTSGSAYLEPNQTVEPIWLVEEFLTAGSLVILGGTSKSGKTCLATALAMAVANGKPFLGQETRPAPVLWCAFEEGYEERRQLLSQFGEMPPHFFTTHAGFTIDSDYGLRALKHWVDRLSMPLIVIDPLFGATEGNLTDGRSARNALMGLKRLANETLATVLVLHHVNKDTSAGLTRERFAESNQLLATASMDILMDSRPSDDGSREIRLQARGRGDHANRTWLVRSPDATTFELIGEGSAGADKSDVRSSSVLAALRTGEGPLTVESVAAMVRIDAQIVRNLLARLVNEGTVHITGKDGRRNLYALSAPHLN